MSHNSLNKAKNFLYIISIKINLIINEITKNGNKINNNDITT